MPNRNWQTPYLQYLHRGELPCTCNIPGDEKELYHHSPSGILTAPQASSNDTYPSPKVRSYCKKYTRGLAVTTQCLEPSLETPSDKVSTGQPRWLTPLGLYAPAKGVNFTQGRRTCLLRPCKQYPSPGRLLCGVWTSSVP
jgi:hypothetical protein